MKITIKKHNNLQGELLIPGDKSISHRSIILGSLATGKSNISGFLESEDCLNTKKAFQKMGIEIKKIKPKEYIIEGQGIHGLKEPVDIINCGNSGTCMRIITGLLASQQFYSVLTGDNSLRSRPMGRIINPLEKMGAKIWSRKNQLAPLSIKGSKLKAIDYKLPVASAQVKSSLLIAGLFARGNMTITEPGPSRDHTERMLLNAGISLQKKGKTIKLINNENHILKPLNINIPGDISSAAYFMAAALITKNSELLIKNTGINPTRSGLLDVIKKMGGNIQLYNKKETCGEPVADILVKSSNLKGTEIKGELIPKLIDEIPIIAVLAARAEGKTIIKDAEELRVKETDRIKAMVNELSKIGIDIKEQKDGMIINGKDQFAGGATIKSYGDHRIAMSMAIAGLCCQQEITITNCECIDTSFPEFLNRLKELL